MIGPAIADVPGIERAFLFGSWAARYTGEPGAEPGDVDLLLVGAPSRRTVSRASAALSTTLGREVNATIVSSDRWERASEGFIRQVKRGPVVEIDLDGDEVSS